MRTILLFSLSLLLSAGWMLAQQKPGSSPAKGSANETIIQGCLAGSAGSYALSDKSGKTYQLEGNTANLSDHVGHEVRLTGRESSAPSESAGGTSTGSSTTETKPKFNVSMVEHVSGSCASTQK